MAARKKIDKAKILSYDQQQIKNFRYFWQAMREFEKEKEKFYIRLAAAFFAGFAIAIAIIVLLLLSIR